MATLSTADQTKVFRGLMRAWSADRQPVGVLKADLLAAVQAIDAFLDANTLTINNAFPAAARAGLTTAQKSELLATVCLARWDPLTLVEILGSVD